MKRILQRIWEWFWLYLLATAMFGLMVLSYQYVMHWMTSNGTKLKTGNAVISNGDTFWITNDCTTNLTNYWFETEKEIKQWEYNTTKWVGKIVVADDSDPHTPRGIGWLKDYELGLRSDGMVVWREKK